MIDFHNKNDNHYEFRVDLNVFNEIVVTKVLYWLSEEFIIYQQKENNILVIEIKSKATTSINSDQLLLKLNQMLIDFKTRDIINQETKNIREILLIKAFANNDEFEDYNLISNSTD
jgi:His-Xaa-Ser system protein HxsD